MINTVVFDFDGTIADTLNLGLNIINSAAHQYGFEPFSPASIERLRSKNMKDVFKELHIPLLKAPFFINKIANQLHQQMDSIKPFIGIKDTLHQLKDQHLDLDIITSNTVDTVTLFLNNNDLNLFNHIYSDKSLFGKHTVIKKYLSKHQIDPQHAIYVGDEIRDIEAAHKAGLKIISVTWGFNSKQALAASNPDYYIDSPHELISVLNTLN